MTVQELIEILQDCPADAKVKIWDDEDFKYIEINRSDVRYNFQYNTVEFK